MILSVKSLLYLDGLLLLGLLFYRWALVDRMKGLIDMRIFALVLLVPAMLIFVPKVELAYAGLLIAAMFARTRPELCAGYLLLLATVPELGLEYRLGDVYLMRLSSTSALAIGALIGLIWTRPTRKLHSAKYDLAVTMLILMFTIMSARGLVFNSYLRAFAENFLTVGVPYILISRSIGGERDASTILSRFYLAGILGATVAMFEATRHWALYEMIPSHLGVSVGQSSVLNVRAGFMRSGGAFLNVTAFAFFLAILPAGLWGIRSYFHRAGYIAVTVLLLGGLLATQSRGAWIACAAGYCALWAYQGLRMRAAAALVGAAVLYAVAGLIVPENGRLAESLGRAGAAADTTQYRWALLEGGLAQIRAYPIFGQSNADLNAALSYLVQGEGIVDFVNTHLFVAISGGLVAFAIWIIIWGVPFTATWTRAAPVGRSPISGLQVVPETMLVVSMVALVFTSTANRGLVWPVVALAMTGPLLALARPRRFASPARKPRPLVYDGSQIGDMAPAA